MLTKCHAKPCMLYNSKRDGCRTESKLQIVLGIRRTIFAMHSEFDILKLVNWNSAAGDVSRSFERLAPFLRLLN